MPISNRSLKMFASDARHILTSGKPALVEAMLEEAVLRLEALQLELGDQVLAAENARQRLMQR